MKAFFVLLILGLMMLNTSAVSTDILDITIVKVQPGSMGEQPHNFVYKNIAGDEIKVWATVRNTSDNEVQGIIVTFYETTGTMNCLPDGPDTQNIPGKTDVNFVGKCNVANTIEGEGYTIYAKATPAEVPGFISTEKENVIGNNQSFAVISVIPEEGAIPVPETNYFLIPIIIFVVLIIVSQKEQV